MIEHKFTEDRLAALYDLFRPPATQRDDFAFYLPLILSARVVLDVGCEARRDIYWQQRVWIATRHDCVKRHSATGID